MYSVYVLPYVFSKLEWQIKGRKHCHGNNNARGSFTDGQYLSTACRSRTGLRHYPLPTLTSHICTLHRYNCVSLAREQRQKFSFHTSYHEMSFQKWIQYIYLKQLKMVHCRIQDQYSRYGLVPITDTQSNKQLLISC